MSTFQFDVFADYFQVLVCDGGSESSISDAWNEQAIRDMFISTENEFSFNTARNMDVPIEIVICNKTPAIELSKWDHIVQCCLNVTTGCLYILGVSDFLPEAKQIAVESGQYIAWILYGGLDSISSDGLEGDDHYQIILLRSDEKITPKVIKRKSYN